MPPSNVNIPTKYDFSGYATKYDELCTDGRTIGKGAFKHQVGVKVPLVWYHQHKSPENILGHAFLFPKEDGVYTYAVFNDTKFGLHAKELVHAGDLTNLSIYANKLTEDLNQSSGRRFVHKGDIQEISIVISAANPGAGIDDIIHLDYDSDDLFIHSAVDIILHKTEDDVSDDDDEDEPGLTVGEVVATFNKDQTALLNTMLAMVVESPDLVDDILDEAPEAKKGDATVKDTYDSLTKIQKDALHDMLGEAQTQDDTDSSINHSQGDNDMPPEDVITTHNVFEEDDANNTHQITHADFSTIVIGATQAKAPSLKEAFLAHVDAFGIENIEVLFPDAQSVTGDAPILYGRDMGWVSKVMNAVHKTPFSRIKSFYADITADEARAKGYVKGAEKFEEKFPILTRETTSQMIYKRQGLHRQDIIEITSFDVVSWMKNEMVVMIKEELARAVLVGDGRLVTDPDKIKPEFIRPIVTDDDIYTHKEIFAAGTEPVDLIDGVTMSRVNYKGAGSPVLYCTTEFLNTMLLFRDTTKRRVYPTVDSLKAALRVSDIIEVPVMDNITRTDGADTLLLLGVYVNLRDYTIGSNKGGELTFFEQFDININKQQYLYETMASGALTRPKAAVCLEIVVAP